MDSKTSRCAEPGPCESAATDQPQVTAPSDLAAAEQKHHVALVRLAANLAADGLQQGIAAHSVAETVDSYRSELAASIISYQERYHGR